MLIGLAIFAIPFAAVLMLLVSMVCRTFWKAAVWLRDPNRRVLPQDPWRMFEMEVDAGLRVPRALGWFLFLGSMLALAVSDYFIPGNFLHWVAFWLGPLIVSMAAIVCRFAVRRSDSFLALTVTTTFVTFGALILTLSLCVGIYVMLGDAVVLLILICLIGIFPVLINRCHSIAKRLAARWFPIEAD